MRRPTANNIVDNIVGLVTFLSFVMMIAMAVGEEPEWAVVFGVYFLWLTINESRRRRR